MDYYRGNFGETTNIFNAYPFNYIYILCQMRKFLKNNICNKICNGRLDVYISTGHTKPPNAIK